MKKISLVVLSVFLLSLIVTPIYAQRGPQKPERGGCMSCIVALFWVPYNYGLLYNEGYKLDILRFTIIPIIPQIMWIIDLVDAFSGKTLTEIEISKGLRDSEFKAWHKYQVEKQ